MMYSQDSMGLGHLRRSSNIAQEVLSRNPGCDVLIVADSPATSLFSYQQGIDCLKLPTVVKTGATSWTNASLSLETERVIRLRAKVILEAFSEFEPDTVLIDHMPVGALGELKPMLDRARRRRPPPRLFLGLRDVLDDPTVIRQVWADLDAYEYLRSYDAVLVYGSPDIYDAASAYGLLPGARSVIYSGYVSPPSPVVSGTRRDREFLLMMGGGGRDAFPLASAFVDALPAVFRELGTPGVLLTGPSMSRADREALVARAPPCVRIERGFGPATDWVRRASAVLTMGGYNSLTEVLKWRKKALVVPRAGPSAEQRIRTRLFSERSLIRVLGPGPLLPEELAQALIRLIAEDGIPDTANIPPLNGAQRSATVLLDGRPHSGLGAGALNGRIRPAAAARAKSRARGPGPTDASEKRRAPGRSRLTASPDHNGRRSQPRAAPDLPLLEAVLDPGPMGPRLGELLVPGARNGWSPCLRSVELIAYRPGRRALIAYDVELPSKGQRMRVLGKHFNDRAQARRVWEAKLALHSRHPRRSLAVPQPLDWIPDLSLVLYKPAVGRRFAVRARDAGKFVRLAAGSLAEFHASGVSLDRCLDMAKEIASLASWAQLVGATHRDQESMALEVLEGLRKLGPEIGFELDVPIHKDFHYEHLILGSRLAVLDLDEMRFGDPSFDLAHFCTYLNLVACRADSLRWATESLQRGFLEEYARLAGWTRDERFTYFCAYTALKIAKQLCTIEGVAPRPMGAEQRRQVHTMLEHARTLVAAVV